MCASLGREKRLIKYWIFAVNDMTIHLGASYLESSKTPDDCWMVDLKSPHINFAINKRHLSSSRTDRLSYYLENWWFLDTLFYSQVSPTPNALKKRRAQQQPFRSGRIPVCDHVLNTCRPVKEDHFKIHHHLFLTQRAIFHTVGAFDFVTKGCRDLFRFHCVTKPAALVWSVQSQELRGPTEWAQLKLHLTLGIWVTPTITCWLSG